MPEPATKSDSTAAAPAPATVKKDVQLGVAVPIPTAKKHILTVRASGTLEIELVDLDGNAVAGEPYVVTFPDGKTRKEGKLDKDGRARIDVLQPGACKVGFPERDAADWERAP